MTETFYKGQSFTSFPNQKIIEIESLLPIEEQDTYLKVNQEALRAAMDNLNTMGSLKLWLYLSRHCEGYIFALSSKDCAKDWGITVDTYKSAVKKLIALEYLQPIDEDSNIYRFVQYP